MKDKYFIDTNILLYLCSTDYNKIEKISKLLDNSLSTKTISIQVLKEFVNVSYKKKLYNELELKDLLLLFINSYSIQTNDYKTIIQSIELKEKYKFSFYDCLIISSALQSNCTILLSEDLQHNQLIENSLTIINPFI